MVASAASSGDDEEVVALTRRLVQFNTSNPPGDEEEAARYLGDYLTNEGIAVEYREVEPRRVMLIARLPGREAAGHLVFSGHLDVVPAEEPGWEYDPFAATRIGGRLIGRGTADMKGGLAAMAMALVTLRRSGFTPRADLMLTASVGEERNMLGARYMAASSLLTGCAYLVVGEPTGLQLCPAQRGILVFRLTVHGLGAHSSMPERGVSAISYMARAITALETHPFPYRHSDLLGAPNFNIGTIEGGVAPNIVPDRCSAFAAVRLVAGQSPGEVEAEIRRVLEDVTRWSGLPVTMDLEVLGGGPALETERNHPLVQAAVKALQTACGTAPAIRGFTGGTEAGILCHVYGMPMVIFGPGQLEQAHHVNEYVDIAELSRAARAYTLLAENLLGGAAS